MDISGRANRKAHRQKSLGSLVLQFVALFIFWLILSGHYQAEFIVLGALAAGLVTFLTHDLVSFIFERNQKEKADPRLTLLRIGHFLGYLPWLLSRIVLANIQVAIIVLNPRMPVEPALLQFRTRLQSTFAQVIVANSITLTPGTLTISLKDGQYIVHALVPSVAGKIREAKIQNKVGAIFLEKKEPPPTTLWAYSLEELET
jgi:multicomponent Na+:H+ antiporter subunit E